VAPTLVLAEWWPMTLVVDELYPCAGEGMVLFVYGHHDRSKFRGACLAAVSRGAVDGPYYVEDVLRGRVRKGYWGDFEQGDGEWCDADWITHACAPDDPDAIGEVRAVTWLEVGYANMGTPT